MTVLEEIKARQERNRASDRAVRRLTGMTAREFSDDLGQRDSQKRDMIAKGKAKMPATTYFDRFFREKNLPVCSWEIMDGDTVHFINSDVVIEAIKGAPQHEQAAIKKMLIRIDFANGDVLDYLKHLATALVKVYLEV